MNKQESNTNTNHHEVNQADDSPSRPKKNFIGTLPAAEQLTDLEPRAEVKGGQTREHILLARQVGVPY